LGVLDANHPETGKYMNVPLLNRSKVACGTIRPATELLF